MWWHKQNHNWNFYLPLHPSELYRHPDWRDPEPILREIRERCPDVTIHLVTALARTRSSMEFQTLLYWNLLDGFTRRTWNYFEGRRGKGIPDGVGATLKKNRLVSRSGYLYIKHRVKGNLRLNRFALRSKLWRRQCKKCVIPAIPSTMRLHQVVTFLPKKIFYHDLSCMCSATENF